MSGWQGEKKANKGEDKELARRRKRGSCVRSRIQKKVRCSLLAGSPPCNWAWPGAGILRLGQWLGPYSFPIRGDWGREGRKAETGILMDGKEKRKQNNGADFGSFQGREA